MSQYVAVRALHRNFKMRVTNSAGNPQTLSPTIDVVIDLDLASNRKALAHHASVGQFIISAANSSTGVTGSKVALSANA